MKSNTQTLSGNLLKLALFKLVCLVPIGVVNANTFAFQFPDGTLYIGGSNGDEAIGITSWPEKGRGTVVQILEYDLYPNSRSVFDNVTGLAIELGGGQDQVQFGPMNFPGDVYVDTGSGPSLDIVRHYGLTYSSVSSYIGGNYEVHLGDGDNAYYVSSTIDAPYMLHIEGDCVVTGGSGEDHVHLNSVLGFSVGGDVEFDLGDGYNNFETNNQIEFFSNFNLSTGWSNDNINIGQMNESGNVVVHGRTSFNLTNFTKSVRLNKVNFLDDVSIFTGNSEDTVVSDESVYHGDLFIRTNHNPDEILITSRNSSAMAFRGDVTIYTGSGQDTLSIENARFNDNVVLATGNHSDELTISGVSFRNNLTVRTYAGDDVVELSESTFDGSSVSLYTYGGYDSVSIGYCQSNAMVEMDLGDENDQVDVFKSELFSTPTSLQVTGGGGFDEVTGNDSNDLHGALETKSVEQESGF